MISAGYAISECLVKCYIAHFLIASKLNHAGHEYSWFIHALSFTGSRTHGEGKWPHPHPRSDQCSGGGGESGIYGPRRECGQHGQPSRFPRRQRAVDYAALPTRSLRRALHLIEQCYIVMCNILILKWCRYVNLYLSTSYTILRVCIHGCLLANQPLQ